MVRSILDQYKYTVETEYELRMDFYINVLQNAVGKSRIIFNMFGGTKLMYAGLMLGMKVLCFIHESDLEDYILHKRHGLYMEIKDFTGYLDVASESLCGNTPTRVTLLDECYLDKTNFVGEATPSSGPSRRGKSKRRLHENIVDDDDNDETLVISHSSPDDVGLHIAEPSLQQESALISSWDPQNVAHDVKPSLEEIASRKGKERRVFQIAEVRECIDLTGDSEEEDEEELNPTKKKKTISPHLEGSVSTVKVEERVSAKEETMTQLELQKALQQAREEIEQREALRRKEYEEREARRKKDDDERMERMMMGLASQIMQQFSSAHLQPQFLMHVAAQLSIVGSTC